jgi:hypothetical protein
MSKLMVFALLALCLAVAPPSWAGSKTHSSRIKLAETSVRYRVLVCPKGQYQADYGVIADGQVLRDDNKLGFEPTGLDPNATSADGSTYQELFAAAFETYAKSTWLALGSAVAPDHAIIYGQSGDQYVVWW